MRNITVTVDEQTFQAARIVAAQRNATVSTLVRDYLKTPVKESMQPDSRTKALFDALDKAGTLQSERTFITLRDSLLIVDWESQIQTAIASSAKRLNPKKSSA
jgi:hypothetical protein